MEGSRPKGGARKASRDPGTKAKSTPTAVKPDGAVWDGLPQLVPMLVPIMDLVPDPANAMSHPERNIDAIRASLFSFGQHRPAVVQRVKNGLVVRIGNGMREAALSLGWTHLAAAVTEDDDVKATARAIADNRTSQLAEWKTPELLRQLDSLAGVDPTWPKIAGFSEEELGEFRKLAEEAAGGGVGGGGGAYSEPGDDDPVEPPKDPVTRLGDVWVVGDHRIGCGDSTDAAVVLGVLTGAKPGIMATDPPYGVEYDPEWRDKAAAAGKIAFGAARRGRVSNDDRVDWSAAWRGFGGDVAYVWHAGLFSPMVAVSLEENRLEIRSQIIWVNPRFAISRGHYHWRHEPCWYAVRRGSTASWIGNRSQTTVIECDSLFRSATGDDQQTDHGTQKPVACFLNPIRNHGHREVYDPFVGSGSSMIAAHRCGKVGYGVDLDPRYVDIAVRRLAKVVGVEARLEETGETFEDVAIERGVAAESST